MSKIGALIAIARTLRKLERLAAKMGYAELSLVIGTAALLATDIVQGTRGKS